MIVAAFASVIIVIVSTLVYTLLLWWADRYEKEPKRLIVYALLWGAVPAALLSIMLELSVAMPGDGLLQSIVDAGITGPIIEEVTKGVMLWILFTYRRLEFDGVLDGIIYGALVGFGFAMTENLLYFVGGRCEGIVTWSFLVSLRQVVFGLNHAFYTAFTGIGFGLARSRPRILQGPLILGGLTLAILFHALHNITITLAQVSILAFLLTLIFDAGGIIVVLTVLIGAILREKRLIEMELPEEVGHTLSSEDFERIRRVQPVFQGLTTAERKRLRRVRQLAAELALKKSQLRREQDNATLRNRIIQLRAALIELRQSAGQDT